MTRALTSIEERPDESSVTGEVLATGGALQQVRTSYCTAIAVQKPRQIAQVERRLLQEAQLAGETFYYGWGAGKDRIEGPSIELAMAAARCWGNCAIEALPVQDAGDAWILGAAFVDLETGCTISRQFRQSKQWTVYGRMDEERKSDIRFQIGQSKAQRNVVVRALPQWLIDKALDEAKAGVRAKLEQFIKQQGKGDATVGLAAAYDLVKHALAKHGVSEERILKKCGVADRRGVDVDKLVVLRGDLYALDHGQDTAETIFPIAETAEGAAAATASKAEELKRKLDKASGEWRVASGE
jgi:hypothetical protein